MQSAGSEPNGALLRPWVELLQGSSEAGPVLHPTAQSVSCEAGEVIFRQNEDCKGLYLVAAGEFLRKAEQWKSRLSMGTARAGEWVELAAALGEGHHGYTLTAETAGSLLMLPIAGVRRVMESYPVLRMKLLEELAREVSRAYQICGFLHSAAERRDLRGLALG